MMEQETILDILKSCGALLEGHFELRSGLHSDRFFQCANVLRYPRTAGRLCEALAAALRAEHPAAAEADTVIAPALGGILVGYELARVLDRPSIFAEKIEGALALRRFRVEPGERVLVAEDVITRGGRVQETIDLVREAGGAVTGVAVLVDRSGGRARFDVPLTTLLRMEPVTYEPAVCPLCAAGVPCVHPGS